MNDYFRRNLEAGQRCRQWFVDYASLIPAGSIFATKSAAMTAMVDDMETTAGAQQAAVGEGLSATDVKGAEREDLIAQMDPVRIAARAAEFDVPGTRDRYRFNRAMAHQDLLAAGRAFAEGGVDDQALLESYGAPAGWPTKITNACNAFEATFALQDSAKAQSVARNAEMSAAITEMNALKSAIRHLVKLYTANDIGAQAAWTSAAHVEKAPSSGSGSSEGPPTP